MINWLMYTFRSSTAEIASTFLSSALHLVQFFERNFSFLAFKINSSTEQTEANLPSAIFQRPWHDGSTAETAQRLK